jgi:uridine phosphorylase
VPNATRVGPAVTPTFSPLRKGESHAGWSGALGTAAVLVAEELFASGCKLLISVTSSGQIAPVHPSPYFVLIERALRDEGTSCHYRPPSDYSDALEPTILALAVYSAIFGFLC